MLSIIRQTTTLTAPACENCRYWSEEPMGGEDVGVCTKLSVPANNKYCFTYWNETCDNHEPLEYNG